MRTREVRLVLLGVLLTVAAELVIGGLVLAVSWSGVLDPDRGPRDVAVRYVRSLAAQDDRQTWGLYSSCYQRQHPFSQWVAGLGFRTTKAPADEEIHAVSVQSDGRYRRVDVRVLAPAGTAGPSGDLEVDVMQEGGRWVVVDTGSLGHGIADACTRGAAR